MKYIKTLIIMMSLGLFVPYLGVNAQTINQSTDIRGFLCQTLSGILSCDSSSTTTTSSTVSTRTPRPIFTDLYSGLFSFSTSQKNTAAIKTTSYDVSQGFSGNDIHKSAVILVKSPLNLGIYRIIDGKKFLIPSDTVFKSYNFDRGDVILISQAQLDSYPRVKLIKTSSSKNVYYLTEGGLTRLIPVKKVFDSYADRNEDVIVINTTEFSFYPQNEYVFNEDTFTKGQKRDVYQITSTSKILVTEQELGKRHIKEWTIAPINNTEFKFYKVIKTLDTKKRNTSEATGTQTPSQTTWTEYN